MSKGIVRLHDKLSSGGEVISASSTMIIDGIKAALLNDLVSCPIEGHGVNRIVGTSPEWQSDSEQAAFDGALCQCGCTVIASATGGILGS
ncbi:PAAR domain-containing protein [Salmonella enterica]|uniref:PAAR domain-containing protein n=2 Tax=Salmonella diarizonae TaxID=59204 RepID=A0A379U0V8_SALDZ|nr:PAAR domain-containing protein [Salmonella enterica]ECO1514531.1 PAAR domain-containing protein [Salmonella enterica subsp. arizonae]EDT4351222.1 PAAR domain-containing protein [Salmonella enterica subsp. diarizonae serovar 50:k:z]EDW6120446.1 PAAR domain-containing protein [Salmonella enterica subsp. salamae]EHJ0298834.1 PAAR domain-containing protein [Salmonella enterica subsp. diarizonae serovar 60:k:z]EIQ3226411.1 PAAR domain-containing protein [Salmonella enterica subsp. diarizonae ser